MPIHLPACFDAVVVRAHISETIQPRAILVHHVPQPLYSLRVLRCLAAQLKATRLGGPPTYHLVRRFLEIFLRHRLEILFKGGFVFAKRRVVHKLRYIDIPLCTDVLLWEILVLL